MKSITSLLIVVLACFGGRAFVRLRAASSPLFDWAARLLALEDAVRGFEKIILVTVIGLVCSGCSQDLLNWSESIGLTPRSGRAQVLGDDTLKAAEVNSQLAANRVLLARCDTLTENSSHTVTGLAEFASCRKQLVNDLCVKFFKVLDSSATEARWDSASSTR
jgi:hypothetical protein